VPLARNVHSSSYSGAYFIIKPQDSFKSIIEIAKRILVHVFNMVARLLFSGLRAFIPTQPSQFISVYSHWSPTNPGFTLLPLVAVIQ
jgi:hypothetical protein